MDVLEESKSYVKQLFDKVDREMLSYHNWKHTMNVFNAVNLIVENTEGVSQDDLLHLQLAAIFHDVGYLESSKGHEERGAVLAREFLLARSLSEESIAEVERLIMATKLKHQPKDIIEKIIIDADLSHLGREDYIDTTYQFLLREIANNSEQGLTDKDWAESCVSFLSAHQFLTQFARNKYGNNKQKNLEKVKQLIKDNKMNQTEPSEGTADEVSESPKEKKKKKNKEKLITPHKIGQKNPLKGVETMFKISLRNHVDLSAIADKKANTLISVNAIIISIVLSALFPKLDSNPFLFHPSVTLLVGCLITIVLAIFSTIPNVTRGEVDKGEVNSKKGNLLFFGNFHKMELKDYEWSMRMLMESKDYIYDSMTRDLFFLGKVLNKKYMLLRYAYYIFMLGLLASIIVFVVNVIPYIGTTTEIDISTIDGVFE